MKRCLFKILFLTALLTITFDTSASAPNPNDYRLAVQGKKISLNKLLDTVSNKSKKKFLLHSKSRAEVVASGIDTDELTYSDLLNIVDLNGMAAVEIEGVINIVPVGIVKQYPVPLIKTGNEVDHESLWVTKVIDVGELNVMPLVPVLRSLVRVEGHMASFAKTNSMVIVAPYNSVKRIESIIAEMQSNAKEASSG